MDADPRHGGERPPRWPRLQRGPRPGRSDAERSMGAWGVTLVCVAAVGAGLLLMDRERPRDTGPAGPRGPASSDLVSSYTPYGGWSAGPYRPRSAFTGGRRPAPALAYSYRRVARVPDPAGGGVLGSHLEIHGLNDAGQALIVSEEPAGETMFLVAPGQMKQIVRPGEPGPRGSRYGSIIYMPEAMNNRGQVVWSGTVEDGESWTFLHDARIGRTAVVLRPWTPAPGGGMFVRGERQCARINNLGEIAFHGYVTDRESGLPVPGVFAHLREETVLIAREGTPAPNGGTFRAAEFAAINDDGAVVFHGTVTGSDGMGVYRWRGGILTSVAVPDTPLPGGRRLEQAFYPQIDRSGRVVFVGQTGRGGTAAQQWSGLYQWVRGVIHPIVEGHRPEGGPSVLPGIGPMQQLEFNGRRPFDLNAAGAVAFIAHGMSQDGVFVWEEGSVKLVALSNAALPRIGVATEVGTTSQQISSYRPPRRVGARIAAYSGPPGGAPPGLPVPYGPPGGAYGYSNGSFGIGLSEDGKVSFLATINGAQCLILATPHPAPPSRPTMQ